MSDALPESYNYTVYALLLPETKWMGEDKYAIKRTVPPHRGKWTFATMIHPGPFGGGWGSLEEAKKEARSFLKSVAADKAKIFAVSVVQLVVTVQITRGEQVRAPGAALVDLVVQAE
jgi:hypothetical protein